MASATPTAEPSIASYLAAMHKLAAREKKTAFRSEGVDKHALDVSTFRFDDGETEVRIENEIGVETDFTLHCLKPQDKDGVDPTEHETFHVATRHSFTGASSIENALAMVVLKPERFIRALDECLTQIAPDLLPAKSNSLPPPDPTAGIAGGLMIRHPYHDVAGGQLVSVEDFLERALDKPTRDDRSAEILRSLDGIQYRNPQLDRD